MDAVAGPVMAGAGPTILTVLVAPIIIILLVSRLWIYGTKKGDSKLPPGDMGWPIVGSTFSLFKPHPATTLSDFMHVQLSRYGKIFSTRFLGRTLVISADPEFNHFVLQNESMFQTDLPFHFKKLLGKDNLIFLTGDAYKRKKAWTLGFINNYQIQTRLLAEVEKAAERVMTQWRHKTQVPADEEINKFVFSLALRITMGMTLDDPEAEELRKAFIAINDGLNISVPLNLPFTRYSKALKSRDIIRSIVARKVEERKLNHNERDDKENDLIWWCLKDNASMSMESICDGVLGLTFGALFNTQNAIALAMYFLEQYPKSLQEIREEFKQNAKDGKIGDRTTKLTWNDYKNMEFCQSVVNETLRFENIAAGLWKKTLLDVNYKGYTIPQGTSIMTHFAVHMDPSAFENPTTFYPWRWLSTKKSNNWMPFGGSIRQCSGSEIARMEISVFLRHLVLNYDWDAVEPDHPVALPLVTFPKGYPIKICPLDEKTV